MDESRKIVKTEDVEYKPDAEKDWIINIKACAYRRVARGGAWLKADRLCGSMRVGGCGSSAHGNWACACGKKAFCAHGALRQRHRSDRVERSVRGAIHCVRART